MSQEKHLFSPITLNNLEIKNRIAMPPMCQYSAHKKDGVANNWHFVHYASRAVGGTGLIIVEMTNVEPALPSEGIRRSPTSWKEPFQLKNNIGDFIYWILPS